MYIMENVRLAPIKGLTKAMSNVQLKSLTELRLIDPSSRNDRSTGSYFGDTLNYTEHYSFGDNSSTEENNAPKSNTTSLELNDVNPLWKVYLNQQQSLGVDTSDRQVMAKLYHDLTKEEVLILRDLYKQEKLGNKSKPNRTKELALKVKKEEKSINKRQQRKKKIRDELKRQLGTFTTLSETEGFPWKAIVSKSGFRDLKLLGWPKAIPRLKRIDDFNPVELNLFEQGIQSGSIRIVERK